jgi:hypothetical protein
MAVTSSGSTAEWDQVGSCCPGKNEEMSRSEQLLPLYSHTCDNVIHTGSEEAKNRKH